MFVVSPDLRQPITLHGTKVDLEISTNKTKAFPTFSVPGIQ